MAISVSLDVAAPKIIVPKSSSKDKGFLLLDMGEVAATLNTLEDAPNITTHNS